MAREPPRMVQEGRSCSDGSGSSSVGGIVIHLGRSSHFITPRIPSRVNGLIRNGVAAEPLLHHKHVLEHIRAPLFGPRTWVESARTGAILDPGWWRLTGLRAMSGGPLPCLRAVRCAGEQLRLGRAGLLWWLGRGRPRHRLPELRRRRRRVLRAECRWSSLAVERKPR